MVFHATGQRGAGFFASHPLTSYVLESGRPVCHCADILWAPCALGWQPLCPDHSSKVSARCCPKKFGILITYDQFFDVKNDTYPFVYAALTTTKCVVSVATTTAAQETTLPNQTAPRRRVSTNSATAGKRRRMKTTREFEPL